MWFSDNIKNNYVFVKNMEELFERFKKIERYYKEKEIKCIKKGIFPVKKTEKGIWGVSDMIDMFNFFCKINLGKYSHFLDLGSGDGRIVLIASLFTKATGIEYDKELYEYSLMAKKNLGIENADFKNIDYTQEDISQYDIIFIYADHSLGKYFEDKIKNEFKGVMLVYGEVFTPQHLRKGRSYYSNMSKIISYHINEEERCLYE